MGATLGHVLLNIPKQQAPQLAQIKTIEPPPALNITALPAPTATVFLLALLPPTQIVQNPSAITAPVRKNSAKPSLMVALPTENKDSLHDDPLTPRKLLKPFKSPGKSCKAQETSAEQQKTLGSSNKPGKTQIKKGKNLIKT